MATPPTPPPQMEPEKSDKRLILMGLGALAVLSIVGYILLGALKTGINTEPLTAIASACIGSLGTYLATVNKPEEKDEQEDYELIIGRAATRSMINEVMRSMGAAPPSEPPGPHLPHGGPH